MIFQYPVATGGGKLATVLSQLQQYGFIQFLIPFLLFFGLIFAILDKVKIFVITEKDDQGKPVVKGPNRKFNGIIAGIISALIVIPSALGMYPANLDPILIVNKFTGMSVVIFVVILLALMFTGLARGGPHELKTWMKWLVLIGILLVLWFAVEAIWPTLNLGGFLSDPTILSLIVAGVATWIVISFITSDSTKPKKKLSEYIDSLIK